MDIINSEKLGYSGQWLKKIVISVLLSVFSSCAAVYAETGIPAEAQSFIQKGLPNASVGVIVLDADTGQTLFESRSQEPFPPASTTKLFTTAASLLSLGANYQFQTAVKIDKKELQKDKLKGNLYVQFSGDPSLTTSDLKQLMADIKTAGIRRISGNIVIDDSRFQSPDYPMGWTWNSMVWYYEAPITTIILNENKVPITLTSNKTLGEKTTVALASSEDVHIKLQSNLTTVTQAESETHCQIEVHMNELNQLNVQGCWPQLAEPITLKVAVKNPLRLAEKIILDTLKSERIVFTGKIVTGKIGKDLTTIASRNSAPLKILLKKVLEDSNNLYSESLIKAMGAERFQRGTFQLGMLALKEVLSQPTGIDFTQMRLMGGSGASMYDLVQPAQLARLLYTMEHDKTVGQDFKETFFVSGGENKESTLYKRFNFNDAAGRIRAKTGTLTGVSALAGYLTTAQNKNLIFVIMMDHFLEQNEKMKAFEDEFCRLLIGSNL